MRKTPDTAPRSVEVLSDGLRVCNTDGCAEIRWHEVERIYASKVDLFTTDCLVILLRRAREGDSIEIDEEMQGAQAAFDAIDAHFANAIRQHHDAITRPAFEENWTLIWSRPTSNAAEPSPFVNACLQRLPPSAAPFCVLFEQRLAEFFAAPTPIDPQRPIREHDWCRFEDSLNALDFLLECERWWGWGWGVPPERFAIWFAEAATDNKTWVDFYEALFQHLSAPPSTHPAPERVGQRFVPTPPPLRLLLPR